MADFETGNSKPTPPPYNAADPEQIERRKKSQKTRDLQKTSALRRLMSDADGRMWMWDLMSRCGVFRLSFSTDPLVMAFNEGRRDIGNHLIGDIDRVGPELYIRMAVENNLVAAGRDKEPATEESSP